VTYFKFRENTSVSSRVTSGDGHGGITDVPSL
jgi:hypothetical protein